MRIILNDNPEIVKEITEKLGENGGVLPMPINKIP